MLSPDSIHSEEYQGYKVWGYNGHIFVSQELKDELVKVADQNYFTSMITYLKEVDNGSFTAENK